MPGGGVEPRPLPVTTKSLMRTYATLALAFAFAVTACNAQPASDAELAELETQGSAATAEEAEAMDEPVADDEAEAEVAADDDRYAVSNESGEDKPDDEADLAVADEDKPDDEVAVPEGLTIDPSGSRGAALRLGASTNLTAPQVQLRVGHPRPTSPQLRPQLQPASNAVHFDLSATGATQR